MWISSKDVVTSLLWALPQVPHPRWAERNFVVAPLADLFCSDELEAAGAMRPGLQAAHSQWRADKGTHDSSHLNAPFFTLHWQLQFIQACNLGAALEDMLYPKIHALISSGRQTPEMSSSVEYFLIHEVVQIQCYYRGGVGGGRGPGGGVAAGAWEGMLAVAGPVACHGCPQSHARLLLRWRPAAQCALCHYPKPDHPLYVGVLVVHYNEYAQKVQSLQAAQANKQPEAPLSGCTMLVLLNCHHKHHFRKGTLEQRYD